MNESPSDHPPQATGETAHVESQGDPAPSGMEINVGDFTRTQGLLKSLRLVLNNQIVVPVEEIAGGLNDAGRKFKLGTVEQANQEVTRLYSVFRQKISQWESQARNLEQQMRMTSAKNPKSISIDTMNRMKSEQIAVRTRIRSTEVQFRRLHQGLDQAFTNLQRQPSPLAGTDGEDLAEFLAVFGPESVANRPGMIQEWFETEAVLKVHVRREKTGGQKAQLEPMPPLDRLYFLHATGQLIRLQQLGQTVQVQDLETGQSSTMKLKEFVQHIQNGVWLLKPRPLGRSA